MGIPLYHLQIVSTRDGTVANVPGGGRLETNLIDLFTHYIMSKGVGWRSSKHVEADIRDGIHDAIWAMKEQTKLITKATQ